MKVDGTNLSMIRGDSESITVSCTNEDGTVRALITGETLYFTVKLNTATNNKLIQKVITIFDGGSAIIEITHQDTNLLDYKSYKYDIQLVDINSRVITLVPPSLFTIEPEITFEPEILP